MFMVMYMYIVVYFDWLDLLVCIVIGFLVWLGLGDQLSLVETKTYSLFYY
jgi:hypothetical protein